MPRMQAEHFPTEPVVTPPTLADALNPQRHSEFPFPHFRVENALPSTQVAALVANFPESEQIRQGAKPGDNRRFSWPARDALAAPDLPENWRDFVAAHVSQQFLDSVLRALADDIGALYPDLEARVGKPFTEWRVGLRGRDTFATAEVLLDAQICINSPVIAKPSSVRGPHVDKPNKLFAGLYYLRPPEDEATSGGELEFYRHLKPDAYFDKAQLDPADVELTGTVPYRGNTLVLFLNSLNAVHGVTPRQPIARDRKFFNLIGEIAVPLFDLEARQRPRSPAHRTWQRLRRAFGTSAPAVTSYE